MAVSLIPNISLWRRPLDTPNAMTGFERIPAQVDAAADRLQLDLAMREFLQHTRREHTVSLPVRMDDGRMRLFTGYRMQHNDALGPCRGPVVYDADITPEILRSQSMYMSLAYAVLRIPFGGSVGAIVVNPAELSSFEIERLSREWVRQVYSDGGFQADVPSGDNGSHGEAMRWMLDELEFIRGSRNSGTLAGQPVDITDILSREEAAGYGAMFAARDALLEAAIEMRKSTACVHGLSEVGRHAVRRYERWGGTITSVVCRDQKTDKYFTIANEDGIELTLLEEIIDSNGAVDRDRVPQYGYMVLPGDAWLNTDPDMIILATNDEPVDLEFFDRHSGKSRIIVEAVPGVLSPDADEILADLNVTVIPDLIASSGGLIHNFMEQVLSHNTNGVSRERLLNDLDQTISTAYREVRKHARQHNLCHRDAALDLAVARLASASRKRGWI